MKKILGLVISNILLFSASVGFAADKSDMSQNWTCTTNASSSSVEAEKAADDKMKNSVSSATSAFNMAEKNCRDCTKITCEKSSS